MTVPSTARMAAGTLAYAAVPALAVAVPLRLAAAVGVRVSPVVGPALVLVVGGSVAALGAPIARRLVADLPERDAPRVAERVERLAAELDVPAPEVRVVDCGAPNVAAVGRVPGEATLVVSDRLPEVAGEDGTDAVLIHAIARSRRDAPVTTAFLPVAIAVETVVLLGLDLVRRRPEATERRAAFGERRGRDLSGVTASVGRIAGVLLLALAAVPWLLLAAGDRLLVAGARRDADRVVAEAGRAGAFADWLVDAPDADGYRDWPPALDRLSGLPLAGGTIRSLRGTARGAGEVREARLRTGRV